MVILNAKLLEDQHTKEWLAKRVVKLERLRRASRLMRTAISYELTSNNMSPGFNSAYIEMDIALRSLKEDKNV